MTNNYFKVYSNGNRRFEVTLEFYLDGERYSTPRAIIDTGCPTSLIPANILFGIYGDMNSPEVRSKMREEKAIAISKGYRRYTHRGIGNSTKSIGVGNTFEDILNNKRVVFERDATNISINHCSIQDTKVRISYDDLGITLIGYELLKQLDIHMGLSSDRRMCIVGCPRQQFNNEYLKALEETFGLATTLGAYAFRSKIKDNENGGIKQ